MKIKNKSLTKTAIITGLGNMIVPQGTTILVPPQFEESRVRDEVNLFPDLVLIEGSIVTVEDLLYSQVLGNAGVMTKDTYDTDYDNIVDLAEQAISAKVSLEIDFDFNDFALTEKTIGSILANYSVENVKIIVENAFDTGQVTIGDDLQSDRFAEASDSDLRFVNTYIVERSYTYTSNSQIKLFMSGSPTVGSGKIVVFIS